MSFQVEHLDIHNKELVAEYENGFYEAFLPLSNPGIRSLWIWDDESRLLRTQIPYEHQEIFFMRNKQGKISSAVAFNMKLEHFQAEAYGFKRPATDHIYAETLTTFAEFGQKLHCFEHGRKYLLTKGAICSYATCSERILPLHLRVGAYAIDKSVTDGQVRYFLRFDLDRPYVKA